MANLTGSIARRRGRHAARADPPPHDPHRSGEGQSLSARHLRRRARRADDGATAGSAPRGVLGVAPHPARAGAERQGRDGRDVGAASRERAVAPARSDRHRRRRTGSPGRTRRRVAERPGGAGGAWHHEELRRHRRRRGPRLRSPPGHDHCARRAERRRQDHGVQPTHRVHPARPRQCQAERQRARGALPRQGGAPRSRPLVPERASLQPHLVRPERDARGAEPAG